MESNKIIIDVCCSSKAFWFNKSNPNVLYCDIRQTEKGLILREPNFEVKPDKLCDFRNLPFKDKSFKMVVFDPPHIVTNTITGNIIKTYGNLNPKTWENDLINGFNECWRILEDYGTLIFKFAETKDIKFSYLLSLFEETPLLGTRISSSKYCETRFFVYMKIPKKTNLTKENNLK